MASIKILEHFKECDGYAIIVECKNNNQIYRLHAEKKPDELKEWASSRVDMILNAEQDEIKRSLDETVLTEIPPQQILQQTVDILEKYILDIVDSEKQKKLKTVLIL